MFIVVHGPRACGKTLNKRLLKRHFKCDQVLDISGDSFSFAGFRNRYNIERLKGRTLVLSDVNHTFFRTKLDSEILSWNEIQATVKGLIQPLRPRKYWRLRDYPKHLITRLHNNLNYRRFHALP